MKKQGFLCKGSKLTEQDIIAGIEACHRKGIEINTIDIRVEEVPSWLTNIWAEQHNLCIHQVSPPLAPPPKHFYLYKNEENF